MDDGMGNGKRYGLACPRKRAPLSAPIATNVFGNDQESEDEDGTADWMKKALKAEGEKNRAKKQTRLDIEKAMRQDPTVCQYDEVFDDMKRREERAEAKNQRAKKPKYIENLLKTAERRKREQEHRIERTVQKEREAEGAAFADKESFVTSAYRAKLEEFKRMEEERENTDRLEAIGDVTKQPDISGFYRHLFHQTVASEKPDADDVDKSNRDDRSEQSSHGDGKSRARSSDVRPTSPKYERPRGLRQYRPRTTRQSESEVEETDDDVNTLSKDDGSEPAEKKAKESLAGEDESKGDSDDTATEKSIQHSKIAEIVASEKDRNENTEKIDDRPRGEDAKKKKLCIWEKRTIGPIFEAALQRYNARKASRLSSLVDQRCRVLL